MAPEPPLEYMLDDPSGPPAGREELLAIVARGGRRRARLAAGGVAVALVAGAAAGWAIADRTVSPANRVAAASAPSTPAGQAPGAKGAATGGSISGGYVASGSGGPTLTRLFARATADGVTVRGFQVSIPQPPAGTPACPAPMFPAFQAELSTPAMVSMWPGFPGDKTAPLSGSVGVAGQAEQAPVWVATAHAGTGIALVRVHFADGTTDQMAPVGGWVALAHAAPAGAKDPTTATLEGLDQQGKVVATTALGGPKPPPMPLPAAGPASGNTVCQGPPPGGPPGTKGSPPVPAPAPGNGPVTGSSGSGGFSGPVTVTPTT